jgi:hypothetical protein
MTASAPSGIRGALVVVIKGVHSAIFFGLLTSLLVFLQRGIVGRADRAAALSGAAVAAEALIFCGNGRRCPLTAVVERIGAERGSVTDIYLPRPIAMHIFELTAPLFVLGIALNARTLIAGR